MCPTSLFLSVHFPQSDLIDHFSHLLTCSLSLSLSLSPSLSLSLPLPLSLSLSLSLFLSLYLSLSPIAKTSMNAWVRRVIEMLRVQTQTVPLCVHARMDLKALASTVAVSHMDKNKSVQLVFSSSNWLCSQKNPKKSGLSCVLDFSKWWALNHFRKKSE